jgi:hypothetical protein
MAGNDITPPLGSWIYFFEKKISVSAASRTRGRIGAPEDLVFTPK